jgi:hypothetical protein
MFMVSSHTKGYLDGADDFARLSAAFFDEIAKKYPPPS